MSPELTNLVMDIAGNTPFIGFLLWNYWDMRKSQEKQLEKMDTQTQKYMQRIDEIRKEGKDEEEKLRERYQKVITELGADRDNLMKLFDQKVKILEDKIGSVDRAIKKIFAQLEDLKSVKDAVKELEIKEKVKERIQNA